MQRPRLHFCRRAAPPRADGQSELYDHDSDPEETRNVAGQHSQVVKDLTEKIHALPK